MGRSVLVTGAAAGIGWATARRFAAAGDRVMIADLDGPRAAARAAELGPAHASFGVDLSTPDGPGAAVAETVARFGGIDVLVNNAGRTDTGGLGVVDQTLDAFQNLLALNLLAVERAAAAAAAHMRARGGGAIVNMASGAALRAIPLRNGYSASKAGVVALTRDQAVRGAPDGVRVNAVAPGYTRTELVDALIANGRVDPAKVAARIPLGRMGTPEEIADTVFFLAGPDAAGVAGALLVADGGGLAYGGSEVACVQRGAPPSAPPPGTPVVAVNGAGTRLGRGVAAALAARGTVAVPMEDDDAEAILARHGRLDGLVTAAGTDGLLRSGPAAPHLAAHLDAAFTAARAVGRVLLRQGHGSVVHVTSVAGQAGLGAGGAAAAAAVAMLARTLCVEWAGSGIRVNAVAAGFGPGDDPALLPLVPLRRAVTPEEVGAAAGFLLSPGAGYVTGSLLAVDGGFGCFGGRDLPLARHTWA